MYEHHPNDEQMNALMSAVDKNGDNAVSFEELIVGITTSNQLQLLGDIFFWRQQFEKFDVDRSGFVDSDEVVTVVQSIAASPLPDDVLQALASISDGQLSWLEFLILQLKLATDFKRDGLWRHGMGKVK